MASEAIYVDYYLAQVNNGGFAQYVYNSRWGEFTVQRAREGLQVIGAPKHFDLFNQSAALIDHLGEARMGTFFASELFGDNEERDILNQFNDKFFALADVEDLIKLNSDWLRSLPHLKVLPNSEMLAEIARRAAALPDREQRAAKALDNEPPFMKVLRALCAQAGHAFSHATAGDPSHKHNGKQTMAMHFITDHGHHYMVLDENNGTVKALMFQGSTHQQIAEMEATGYFL